jgi:hypothetical protein
VVSLSRWLMVFFSLAVGVCKGGRGQGSDAGVGERDEWGEDKRERECGWGGPRLEAGGRDSVWLERNLAGASRVGEERDARPRLSFEAETAFTSA